MKVIIVILRRRRVAPAFPFWTWFIENPRAACATAVASALMTRSNIRRRSNVDPPLV